MRFSRTMRGALEMQPAGTVDMAHRAECVESFPLEFEASLVPPSTEMDAHLGGLGRQPSDAMPQR